MYGCESRTIKKAECWIIDVLELQCFEKTLESLLDCRQIKLVNPKGNQPWMFIGRTDAEAEAPILWPPDAKSWLIGKDSDAGKGWRQEEKGMAENKLVGWHHWLNGHEFEQALGDGDGQGSLVCCSPGGCRVRHDWVTTTTTKGKDESDNLTLEVQGVHEVIMAESIPEARTLNSYWMVHFCPEWNYSSGR